MLIFAPNIETAEKFNKTLEKKGFNLRSDGRPILGMSSKDILKLMLEIDERMVMIPAHAWTPWFGIFGSKGGYDSLEDAFDELAVYIKAIETGLSSNPIMNWRLSALDNITLISNSDAHSLQKIGREANIFQFKNEDEVTYKEIMRIIQEGDKKKFLKTVEFYPEEGKYYADGHRDCKFFCSPEETKKLKGLCPKCNKPLIIGVLNRVVELADRTESQAKKVNKIPYKSIVPLVEILAGVLDKGVSTKTVQKEYNNLIDKIGNEFSILLDTKIEEIEKVSGDKIAKAVDKVRKGEVILTSGFDGEFGEVHIK